MDEGNMVRELPDFGPEDQIVFGSFDLDRLEAGEQIHVPVRVPPNVPMQQERQDQRNASLTAIIMPEIIEFFGEITCGNTARKDIMESLFDSYDELADLMTNVTEDDSIKKLMIRPGTGKQVMNGHCVKVHYLMYAENVDEPIGTSFANGLNSKPTRFRVGSGECIALMDVALTTMKVGEVSKFLGTPAVGFGVLGCPDRIPPNSRILIQIKVLETNENKTDIDIFSMSHTERNSLPFEKFYYHLLEVKNSGNRAFHEEEMEPALELYEEVYDSCCEIRPRTAEEYQKLRELSYKVACNISLTLYNMGRYKLAVRYAKQAQNCKGITQVGMAKAFFHNARALFEMGLLDDAFECVKKASACSPYDDTIRSLMKKIEERVKLEREKEAELCKKMFEGFKNDDGGEDGDLNEEQLEASAINEALGKIRLIQ